MAHTFLFSPDPQVGKPFKLTLIIQGVDGTGNPLAVIGDKYQVFSENTILFVTHEMKVVHVDAANDHLAEVVFTSRDGFSVEGDKKLWVEHSTDPTIHEETTVSVAARPKAPAIAPVPPTVTGTPITTPASSTTATPPIDPKFNLKEMWANIDWWKVAGWAVTILIVATIILSFYYNGIGSKFGWVLTAASLLGAIAFKGGRNKLGWLIASFVMIFFIGFIVVVVVAPFHVLNQGAENGKTAGILEAPQVPAPPTKIERVIDKMLAAVSVPVAATVTAAAPEKKTVKVTTPVVKPQAKPKKKSSGWSLHAPRQP